MAINNANGRMEINMSITKETTMGEMLQYDRGIAYILMQNGMHCVGCPSSIGESLEEACMVTVSTLTRF
jgi:hybrid cluster-associated redox disulfide protein